VCKCAPLTWTASPQRIAAAKGSDKSLHIDDDDDDDDVQLRALMAATSTLVVPLREFIWNELEVCYMANYS